MILELAGVVTDATKPAGTISQMVPTRRDIVLPRGEPLTIKLTVYKQDRTKRDIATDTIKLGIRQFQDDVTAKATRQASPVDAPNGRADIVVPAAATDPLSEFTTYWYDIQLIESGGNRYQLVPFSAFKVAPVVNRSSDANT